VVSERRAFGDRARRQRERRGVTLETIAQSTKVPASLFAGLERGDCSRWPAGVYSRAYVKAYAQAIGLDVDEAVEDFTAAFGNTLPDAADRPPARRVRAAGALRLALDAEPSVEQQRIVRRAAVALADLLVAFGVAWLAHLALDTGLWTTAGFGLAYHAFGRLLTDEPLVAWVFTRSAASTPEEPAGAEEVPVSDAASTAA
jgi:transcriptional regulator with XRE-family HTH domain